MKKEKSHLFLPYFELGLRLSLAFILISNSGVGLITPLKDLGLPPHIYQIIDGMWKTGFMMHLVKFIELITGLMFFFNFYVPLAVLALLPVVVNIYGIHIFLFHSFLTNGLYMLLICLFLIFRHKKKFLPLLQRK